MNTAHELVYKALAMAATAHHWHLTTQSYARHLAFGELYDYCHDIADTLAEKLMGSGEVFAVDGVKQPLDFTNPDKAIPLIEDFAEDFEDILEPEWLTNIAQEIQGRLYAILYKLKRLN